MKVDIPMYHDVWLDNGVVNLYRIVEDKKCYRHLKILESL